MTIRNRITLQFSIIVSVILVIFSITVYVLFSHFRQEKFMARLRGKALNTVKLLANVDEVDNELLKIIDQNAVNLMPLENVQIIDNQNKVVYTNPVAEVRTIDLRILDQARAEKEVQFHAGGDMEGIAISFKGKYADYVVVASAWDKHGISKLDYLRTMLIAGDIIAIALIVLIGLFFSKQALQPLSNVVGQIDKITATNLGLRVDEGNSRDEISHLAVKFNKMLERLDAAFVVQRSFVANASHELRTPLTTLTGQLEVTLLNDVGVDTAKVLKPLLHEIKQLNKLSNGLLELAQADQDLSEISVRPIRIDELIGMAQAELSRSNKDYRFRLELSEFPEENWLTINANEQLLKSALVNVLENACKYSADHTASINLSFDSDNLHIRVVDNGIGISREDLSMIFEPFFRSADAKEYSGHGIGLTLAKKIVQMHNGSIHIESELGKGTVVEIVLPHLS